MDLTKSRPLPRINIETDSINHLSLGHRCHKKCPGHTHQCVRRPNRRSTNSKIYTGDEHWTKVLQANDIVGGDIVSCPYHSRCRRRVSLGASDRPLDAGDHCLSQSVVHCTQSRSSKETSAGSSSSTAASIKDKTFFHSIYSRFCQWIDSTRKDPASGCPASGSLHRLRSAASPRISRRSSLDSEPVKTASSAAEEMAFDLAVLLAEKAASVNGDPCSHRALSSSDSELGSAGASFSSTCSSLTVTSTSTTTSDCCPSCGAGGGASSAAMSDCSNLDDGFLSDDVALSGTSVCGNCSKMAAFRQAQVEQFLPVTGSDVTRLGWPRIPDDPDSWFTGSLDKDDGDERDDDFDGNQVSFYEENIRDSLVDWNIPIGDVEVADCLRKGVTHDVFRGRWHGDIFMYSFHHTSEADVQRFLHEVTRLSKIRHENICLFMGACLQPPNLAVITSELKGISVYEKLHLSADRIPMRSRVNIGRQVAQAMGYLHAKGITAQVLNSRNIYLEPKVKLSLLYQGMADQENIRLNEICFARGNLTYLAPEMLRDLCIGCDDVAASFDTSLTTVHTDVFAFGTLLYELFTGQFPFRGLLLEEILFQVCSGKTQTLINLCCNTVLKVLIERCWSMNPKERPPFSDINHELQQKTGLHKRHSSSQPEGLDRQNSFTDKCLL